GDDQRARWAGRHVADGPEEARADPRGRSAGHEREARPDAALLSRPEEARRRQRLAGGLPPRLGRPLRPPRRDHRAKERIVMNEVHERQKTSITTPSDTEIRIERIFDAPRQLVWDAYHDP